MTTEPGSYWAKYPPMVSGLPASLAPRSMAKVPREIFTGLFVSHPGDCRARE